MLSLPFWAVCLSICPSFPTFFLLSPLPPLFSPSCALFLLFLLILLPLPPPPPPTFPSRSGGPQREHHAGPAMPSTYAVSRHGSSPSTG